MPPRGAGGIKQPGPPGMHLSMRESVRLSVSLSPLYLVNEWAVF